VFRVVKIAALFLFFSLTPVFSQSENVITSIQINGLKKTRYSVAEKPLQRFLGQDAKSINIDQVKMVILELGILQPISVVVEDEADGTGKTLVVEVQEMWTIFPVPVLFSNSGGLSGGLFFYNANVFGLNHKMALGGILQSSGWMAVTMYNVPPLGSGHFGFSFNAMFNSGERRTSNEKNETLRLFNANSINIGTSLQYKVNNDFNASFNVSYVNIGLRDTENPVRRPDSGAHFLQFGTGVSMHKSSWDGFLSSEENFSIRYTVSSDISSSVWHSISFRGVYQKPIMPGFKMSFRGGGTYKTEVPVFLESGPGSAEVNILPNSFSAWRYAGLSAGLEKSLLHFSFGTISLYGAWQMVYSYGPILDDRFDYGLAGFLRLYLNRLAIPAVGLGVAYNIPAGYFQFSFSMGMSF